MQRGRACSATGYQDRFYFFWKQKHKVLLCEADNCFRVSGTVRDTGRVAEIYNVFIRQQLYKLFYGSKAANAGIKYAYWLSFHLFCCSYKPYALNFSKKSFFLNMNGLSAECRSIFYYTFTPLPHCQEKFLWTMSCRNNSNTRLSFPWTPIFR